MKAILLAAVAAIAIQPFVFVLLVMLPMLAQGAQIPLRDFFTVPWFAALLSVPFIVLIGIPALLALRRFNRLTRLSLGAIGFMAAALPIAIYGWSDGPGYSSGGNWYGAYVQFVVTGQRTFYGWLQYCESVLFFGLHGLAGALTFLYVWRRSVP